MSAILKLRTLGISLTIVNKGLIGILITFSFLCCQSNNDEKMKNDVIKYFETVKNNDKKENEKLFSKNGFDYSGIIPANFHFIRENYSRINPDSLSKKMSIDDSFIISPEIKIKKIEFIVEAKNDTLNMVKPLIITFGFPVPYKEKSMTLTLKNALKWRDNKSEFDIKR